MPGHQIPIPPILKHIPSQPSRLYYEGTSLEEILSKPRIAIVGSRRITPYGKQITQEIAASLAGQGVVVISGLAYGVDGVAHQSALEAQGQTIAVLPSPLQHIAPTGHSKLARRIVEQGGGLITEYGPSDPLHKYNFVNRNRLVSGLADAVLIVEAARNSGSLRTAEFALDQGKTVMAVPGNIYSPMSAGTNDLIKQGATPITSYSDVLQELGIAAKEQNKMVMGTNSDEQCIIDLLYRGTHEEHELLQKSRLDISRFNQTISMLELSGKVHQVGRQRWQVRT